MKRQKVSNLKFSKFYVTADPASLRNWVLSLVLSTQKFLPQRWTPCAFPATPPGAAGVSTSWHWEVQAIAEITSSLCCQPACDVSCGNPSKGSCLPGCTKQQPMFREWEWWLTLWVRQGWETCRWLRRNVSWNSYVQTQPRNTLWRKVSTRLSLLSFIFA